jgi:hypothetical protein
VCSWNECRVCRYCNASYYVRYLTCTDDDDDDDDEDDGIAVNTLWPRTGIATAAIEFIAGSESLQSCRTPDIMADAAFYILTRPSLEFTGNFCIDDEVLESEGYAL